VAFSFAGEKREYVSQVASILAQRFGEAAILYDKYHEAEFGRDDLGFILPDLYHDESDLVVAVFCPKYEQKEWCGLEWRAVFDLLKQRRNEEVMLCRFDRATARGIYSTAGFVDLDDKTPELAATRILERLALNEGKPKDHYFSSSSSAISSITDFRGASSRLSSGSDLLIGREEELKKLDGAWSGAEKKNVVTIVAWGGVGKTSLVARWAANTLAKENYGGIERYFDWSFYSQGTRADGDATGADKAASSDIFIKAALEFFGASDLASSNVGAWEKGERLALLVGEHRTVLILDGLEPLQDAKNGDLRDEGLRALLRGLAVDSRGLCLLTTRHQLPELNSWHTTTAPEWSLLKLSREAGAELLKKLGVQGTSKEREQLAADVKGHALTLALLGKYLAEAHGGDICKRDLVSLAEADYEETSGHAFRVIEAYERWLERDGRNIELAILRLLGLFDRPATPDCLSALRKTPVIKGLTDSLVLLKDAQWNLEVKRLVRLGLVEEQIWEPRAVVGYSEDTAKAVRAAGQINTQFPLSPPRPFVISQMRSARPNRQALDTHPLIREYFAYQLRATANNAFRAAHGRLFDYLCSSVPYWPEGLDGLQPLYQAVAHGCQAGRYEETANEVYFKRILRAVSGMLPVYSMQGLGAMGADLAAVRCFFVEPWTRPVPLLSEDAQGLLINAATYCLSSLGRLSEAREAMPTGIEIDKRLKKWSMAAIDASNLSHVDLTLGEIESAIREAEQSVIFADRAGVALGRAQMRTGYAEVLHHAGRVEEARAKFEEVRQMERIEDMERGRSFNEASGFLYCELLLAGAERDAWRAILNDTGLSRFFNCDSSPPALDSQLKSPERDGIQGHHDDLSVVEQGALRTLNEQRTNSSFSLRNIALQHLTLARVALYRTILACSAFDSLESDLSLHFDDAVNGLRQSGEQTRIPAAFLTRAWLRSGLGYYDQARADINEAEQIAERGPMPLHLADIHLHRARLFFRQDLEAAREDLKRARALIEKHGYLRRMPELEDAEKVILAAK
jgi:tetratricopeptide (TPR) repeat protein